MARQIILEKIKCISTYGTFWDDIRLHVVSDEATVPAKIVFEDWFFDEDGPEYSITPTPVRFANTCVVQLGHVYSGGVEQIGTAEQGSQVTITALLKDVYDPLKLKGQFGGEYKVWYRVEDVIERLPEQPSNSSQNPSGPAPTEEQLRAQAALHPKLNDPRVPSFLAPGQASRKPAPSNPVGYGDLSKKAANDEKWILCFDGGGTRGILSLMSLLAVERYYGKPLIEIFDMFAGTSTGAIIAAFLAKGGRLDELVNIYDDLPTRKRLFSTNKDDQINRAGSLILPPTKIAADAVTLKAWLDKFDKWKWIVAGVVAALAGILSLLYFTSGYLAAIAPLTFGGSLPALAWVAGATAGLTLLVGAPLAQQTWSYPYTLAA